MPNIVDLTPGSRAERRAAEQTKRHQLRPRIVSVEDAARYANVSRAQFYAFFMSRVKSVKMGRRRGIELDSLDDVLDELSA